MDCEREPQSKHLTSNGVEARGRERTPTRPPLPRTASRLIGRKSRYGRRVLLSTCFAIWEGVFVHLVSTPVQHVVVALVEGSPVQPKRCCSPKSPGHPHVFCS
ncbi:unnamed protein product [Ectocarpus fasciculatus]